MAKMKLFEFLTDKTGVNKEAKLVTYWMEEEAVLVVWFELASQPHFNKILTAARAEELNVDYSHNPNIGKLADYKFCESTKLVEFRGILGYPYAERVETPDAPYCGLAECDLRIVKIDITPESGQGLADGVAAAEVTGTFGGKEFALLSLEPGAPSELLYQQSATFGGLRPGDYTMNARDANGCIAIKVFTVPAGAPLVYGLRFFLNFDDHLKKKYSLRILRRFFAGVAEKVCASAQPTIVDYAFEQGNRFKHTIGSQLTFTLKADYENQFLEFFTFDEREFRAELWDNEGQVLLWAGYVLPDTYSEPWTAVPKNISIRATDGLGTLKDRPFLDNVGNRYVGELSAWDVIRLCIKPLQLRLPWWESDSWYETTMDQGGQISPLAQVYGDVAQYYASDGKVDSCEEVLVKILSAKQLQLFQYMGHWTIIQPNWVAYKDAPDAPPPPPTWAKVSFDLFGAKVVFQSTTVFGQASITNLAGGNPADGPYEYSLDGQTWALASSLEADTSGYLLKNLTVGGSGIVYLRRGGKPDDVAERGYSIPGLSPESILAIAQLNVSTMRASVRITRVLGEYPVAVNYSVYNSNILGQLLAKITSGTLTIPEGNKEFISGIGGTYNLAVTRHVFIIDSTTPVVGYNSETTLLRTGIPIDQLPGFGK